MPTPEEITEVKEWLKKITVKMEGMDQEDIDSFVASIVNDITDEDIVNALKEKEKNEHRDT